ncbi:hypothetical protein [Streptomyces sp. NPDC002215]|uniref:hypothetical protein n=1 Tax=Streptomyces sp. NPDC002215 TaxID=3154412 RepID=UPI003320C586
MTTPRPRPATVTVRIKATPDADTAPADFFVPGTHYGDGDGFKAHEQTHTFQCEHIALHPRPGAGPRAFGFLRNNAPGADWVSAALSKHDFPKWTRIPTNHTEPNGDDTPTDPTTP